MTKCIICDHKHPARKAGSVSLAVCKTCGMVLSGKRYTLKRAGKIYAFCCTNCKSKYQNICSMMKDKLRRGEISEKDFQDFDRGVVI